MESRTEERDAISIDKEDIPYEFQIDLDGTIYTFVVKYNSTFDYFTVDLSIDDEVIVYGAQLIYGTPLFTGVTDERIPSTPLIPFDVAGIEGRITYDNMNETVFLFVMDGETDG